MLGSSTTTRSEVQRSVQGHLEAYATQGCWPLTLDLNFGGVIVMNAVRESTSLLRAANQHQIQGFEVMVDVTSAARFLGVSPSLVYAHSSESRLPISE